MPKLILKIRVAWPLVALAVASVLTQAPGRLPTAVALNRGGLALNRAQVAQELTPAEQTAAYIDAGTAFQRALAQWPDSARAYAGLGAMYTDFDDTAAAAQAFGEAVAIAPGDRIAQYFYAEALAALGEEAAARDAWDAARAAGVLISRAKSLKSSDPAAALLNAERAVAVAPDNPESVLALGDILTAQGAITDALALYQNAAARVPDEAGYPYQAGVLLRRHFGDPDGALDALETALSLNPDDGPTRLELARIFVDRGACYEAEGYLAPLLATPPLSGDGKTAYVLAAQCHLNQDRPRTALPYLEAVVSDTALAGKDPAVSHLLLLASAYRTAGEVEAAVETYTRVLALKPDHAGAQKALDELEGSDDA